MYKFIDRLSFVLAIPVAVVLIAVRLISALIQTPVLIVAFIILSPFQFVLYWMEKGKEQAFRELRRYPRDLWESVSELFEEAVGV